MLSKKLFLLFFLLLFLLVSTISVLAVDDNESISSELYNPPSAPKSSDNYLNPDRWDITPVYAEFDANWTTHVNTTLGSGWVVADWLEMELLFASIGQSDFDAMHDRIGITPDSDGSANPHSGFIFNDGTQYFNSGRSYYPTRFYNSSVVPPSYTQHDHIGVEDYYALGSWYNKRYVYSIILNGAARNTPENLVCTNASTALLNVSVWDEQNDTVNVTIFDGDNNTLTTANDVDSGSEVTYSWTGLDYDTTYYWWVSVTDGTNTTNNTMFNFTTCEQPLFGDSWIENSSLKSGLPVTVNHGWVMADWNGDGDMDLMSQNNGWKGYSWTGSSWTENSSLVSGLSAVASYDRQAAISDLGTSTFHLVVSAFNPGISPPHYYDGYSWNGSSWVSNSSLVSGLSSFNDGYYGLPDISTYVDPDNYGLIVGGRSDYSIDGYSWSGSSWVSNSSLVSGLSAVDLYSSVTSFDLDSDGVEEIWLTDYDADMYGYSWTGSSWVSNSSLLDGLSGSSRYAEVNSWGDDFAEMIFNAGDTKKSYYWGFSSDSCSYGGSGDWLINLSDDCVIDSSETVSGDIVVSGDAGSLVFNASVSAEGFSFEADDFDGDSVISFLSGSMLGLLV